MGVFKLSYGLTQTTKLANSVLHAILFYLIRNDVVQYYGLRSYVEVDNQYQRRNDNYQSVTYTVFIRVEEYLSIRSSGVSNAPTGFIRLFEYKIVL